jgi:hypothetical protein
VHLHQMTFQSFQVMQLGLAVSPPAPKHRILDSGPRSGDCHLDNLLWPASLLDRRHLDWRGWNDDLRLWVGFGGMGARSFSPRRVCRGRCGSLGGLWLGCGV